MDLNSRLFDSIRIKPTCDEPKPAAEAGCESPGCKNCLTSITFKKLSHKKTLR